MNSHTDKQFPEKAELVDLTEILKDKTYSLHQLAQHTIQSNDLCGHIVVVDLNQVFATDTAITAIKRAYLTIPLLIERYAKRNTELLLRELTRGSKKGLFVVDPRASIYEHFLEKNLSIVVQGETIEVDGANTRRLTITCRNNQIQGEKS